MIKLKKLYSIPETFEPIIFEDGINLILGEKVSDKETVSNEKTRKDKKTNGVGKSMCVEFINFCLLKDEDSSRVIKIPLDKFKDDVRIRLDLSVNGKDITIERTKAESSKPIIETEDEVNIYKSVDEALLYLTNLFYGGKIDADIERPTFRQLISPLIRDEDSEFKDIVNCHDLRDKIPYSNLAKTHLYFFNINAILITEIKKILKTIEGKSQTYSHIKNRLTDSGAKKISDVKAELNALDLDLSRVEEALDKFKTEPLFQQNQDDLVSINASIDKLRTRQLALKYEIKRIESMPKVESINISEVQLIYDKFKSGLGSVVSESIEKVVNFKKKIEKYQNLLINERAEEIKSEIKSIQEELNILDDKRSAILTNVDKNDVLSSLKESFYTYSRRKDQYSATTSNLDEYERIDREIDTLKRQKDNLFSELDDKIFDTQKIIRDFNKTLTSIHEYIMGNAEIVFDIETVKSATSKQIVKLDFRIPDDGSHSVDRTKVFIYDIALMLNAYTSTRHPMFLVHDNIFDVDQDTLVQSLNYLAEQEEKGESFQYILTLNRDKIENEERKNQIKLNIEDHIRARFNRRKRFLKVDYKQLD
ncbi:MAG: DUF2326 domain-containing protein [Candidatus Paceibacterota bacterium]